MYLNLKNPKNVAKINGDPIKYNESGSYLLEMLDFGDSLKKVLVDNKEPFDHATILNFSLQIALGLAQL